MSERIFNLYLEIQGQMIYELGAVCHEMDGSDEAKLKFLQQRVKLDLQAAKRYPIPQRYEIVDPITFHRTSALNYDTFELLSQAGKHLEVFEEIFEELHAPADPLVAITPIVDGTPKFDVIEYF